MTLRTSDFKNRWRRGKRELGRREIRVKITVVALRWKAEGRGRRAGQAGDI